jgi:hypothetical protein
VRGPEHGERGESVLHELAVRRSRSLSLDLMGDLVGDDLAGDLVGAKE